MGCGRATALQVSENRHTHIVLRIFILHALGETHCATGNRAFGNKDDRGVFALAESVLDEFGKLVHLGGDFRDNCGFGTRSNSAVEGEESGIASHHLDEEQALVRSGGVADFIDTLHDCVEGGVVSYCCVGSVQVVVDCSRQTYDGHIKFGGEHSCTRQRAVSTYHHESVDFLSFQCLIGLFSTFGGFKFRATGGFEDCTTHLDNIRYVLSLEFYDFTGD